jgi:hypothetical protein
MEERADYLMEAYLDEQNTLIRPLVNRKLHLVRLLDERAQAIESLLEEKRKNFFSNRRSDESSLIEALEDELEQLSIEKVTILQQLMDLVKRPFDTIVEVEETLLNSVGSSAVGGVAPNNGPTSKKSSSSAAAASTSAVIAEAAPMVEDLELWCFCRKPDDGRPMVGCDNSKCDLGWWHADCIEKYISANRIGSLPPDDNRKWHCPVCVAQELALGSGSRSRRK